MYSGNNCAENILGKENLEKYVIQIAMTGEEHEGDIIFNFDVTKPPAPRESMCVYPGSTRQTYSTWGVT